MIEEEDEEEKIDSFNVLDTNIQLTNKLSLKYKILITSLIILILSLLIGLIFLIFIHIDDKDKKDDLEKDIINLNEEKKKIEKEKKEIEDAKNKIEAENKKKEEENKKKEEEDFYNRMYELVMSSIGYNEPWFEVYGNRTQNISYDEDDKIPNSFKSDGVNYREEIGNINNGNDYKKNERNIYDLYIPQSSLSKKDKYNGIMLFIHGGGWQNHEKDEVEFLCSRYAKLGYITANVEYTLLRKENKEFNIFRIIDEITACIKSIKNELTYQGFNPEKLELSIGGISAGAHLSLLYSYLDKSNIIPIKFIIDIVGPVSLEPQYWYFNTKNESIYNISNKKDINDFINNKTITKMEDEYYFVSYMNLFLGNKYKEEELREMMDNNTIKIDNPKYQEMLKNVENAFPIKLIKSNPIPLLCEYGGSDELVGVAQFSYLKEEYDKLNGDIYLVYMRYGNHALFHYFNEIGINAMKEMHQKILEFAGKYFTSN